MTMSAEETATKILIVDDNPTNLKVLLEVLEAAGFSVLVAPGGESALKIAGQALPDLILLDVMMPVMDGYEVCRRLKQEQSTRAIPVIFITANDQTEGVVAGFDAGGVDYIPKPFRREEVLSRVNAHLRLRSLARELEENNAALEERNDQLSNANRQIEEATRRKSDFLARMSHDLRTPMNAIIGYTNILRRRLKDTVDDRQHRNLDNIHTSSQNLLSLINEILDLSRIEAGRVSVAPREVSLKNLAEDCATSVAPLIATGVELCQELGDVDPIRSDEDLLRRVLMNLLGNAAKFTERGHITVSLRSADGLAEIAVADTGMGIPEEDLPHIFEEFRQVTRQGSAEQEGTGLGLAIAKKSVEMLGGTLSAESEIGVGTTFTLRIGDCEF